MRNRALLLLVLLVCGATLWAATTPAKYTESPLLAARVAKGELPALAQRLPANPKVIEPIEGIGKYGGQMVLFNNDYPVGMRRTTLYRTPRSSIGIEPNLAESYQIASDKKSFTVILRKGLKWSDGAPFTSEDIRFMYDDMNNYNFPPGDVRTWGATRAVTSTQVIDELTIKLVCPNGIAILPMLLSDWQGSQTNAFQPAHYLKQWHKKYNPDAEKLAKEAKFDNWMLFFMDKYWWAPLKNPQLPAMDPWILTEYSNVAQSYTRNPYYWKVDPAGQQLPYMDKMICQTVDNEVYQLKVTSGVADFAWFQTTLDNIALYKANEAMGGYRVILHPGISASIVKIQVNRQPKDEALRPIFNDIRFRQALSVAINRTDINKTVYQGLGKPGQLAPLSTTSYYKQGWREYYAQYDPTLANKLLDEMGLNKKDRDGYRLRPDGQPLSFLLEYTSQEFTPVLELVREYWEDVGVRTTFKFWDIGALDQRMQAFENHTFVNANPNIPWTNERKSFQLEWTWTADQYQWAAWLTAKQRALNAKMGNVLPPNWRRLPTPEGTDEKTFPGLKPPDDWIDILEKQFNWTQTDMGSPEYVRLAQEVFDYHVKNLNRIGIVGELPSVMIANKNLGNVLTPGWVRGAAVDDTMIVEYIEQLYWK